MNADNYISPAKKGNRLGKSFVFSFYSWPPINNFIDLPVACSYWKSSLDQPSFYENRKTMRIAALYHCTIHEDMKCSKWATLFGTESRPPYEKEGFPEYATWDWRSGTIYDDANRQGPLQNCKHRFPFYCMCIWYILACFSPTSKLT